MKAYVLIAFLTGSVPSLGLAQVTTVNNTNIDMAAYLEVSKQAAEHRLKRRLSEGDFIRMAGENGTIVLDARSPEMFELLHVKGAVNLSFPDISIDSLAKLLPNKSQRILIYCNNNFLNEPRAFAEKRAVASLNLSTYIALYSYGYTNVYELGPLLDVKTTRIQFEGTSRTAAGVETGKEKTGAP